MDDLDIQEKVRGLDIRKDLDEMINKLSSMPVGVPLVWLYVWDVIKSAYDSMSHDEGYTMANPDYSIDDVWDLLWSNPIFSLEFGVEQLDEDINAWLIDNEFIIPSEFDGEDEDVLESTGEEV